MRQPVMPTFKSKAPASSSSPPGPTPKKPSGSGLFRGRLSSLSNKPSPAAAATPSKPTSSSAAATSPPLKSSAETPLQRLATPAASNVSTFSAVSTPSLTRTPAKTMSATPMLGMSMLATPTPTPTPIPAASTNHRQNYIDSNVSSNGSTPITNNKEPPSATHIEVCVRIRPLEILMEREGFFDSKPQGTPSSSSRLQPRKSPGQPGGLMSPETWITKKDEVVAWTVNDEGDTASQSPSTDLIQGRTHSYTLDKVYGPDSITKNLYDNSVNPLVKAAMEGYHSSILAYGQTSTGKTFTMTGTRTSPGLIPRCIGDCFKYIKSCPDNREYLFRLSYLEVYNEHIRDLLAETPQPIRLFENQSDGLIIKGLKEEIVTSPDHVFSILRQGEKRRQVGATHMNLHSSRSHTMVRLWIESTDSSSNSGQSYTTPSPAGGRRGKSSNSSAARISSLSLVDLAGSESVRLNGGDRRDEGTYINKSLMTLGKVVSALSENNKSKTSHIPYRDSKLTRLLQPSLSGNARMVLICCISPVASHLEESHNTFKFATRAKRIEQKAVINHAGDNEQTLLQTYRDEIDDLRRQLAEAKEEQEKLKEKQQRVGNGGGSAMSSSSPAGGPDAAEEVEELLEAIQSMERLILKSRQGGAATPAGVGGRPPLSNNSNNALDENARGSRKDEDTDESEVDLLSDLLDDELNAQDDDDDEDVFDLRVDAAVSTSRCGESSQWGGSNPDAPLPASPPRKEEGDDLDGELRRIRGLLGSVLHRRGASPTKVGLALGASSAPNSTAVSPEKSPPRYVSVSSNLFGTPHRNGNGSATASASVLVERDEVQTLKKQLIQQEATTNLSKADATFLQNQLREKDDLLEEIAKVLEAVEKRQTELERENAALRLELAAVTSQSRIPQN